MCERAERERLWRSTGEMMSSFFKSFESIAKLNGVQGVLAVGLEGDVTESVLNAEVDVAQIAALVSKVTRSSHGVVSLLGKGQPVQSYVEHQGKNMTIEFLPTIGYLVVVGESGANLGRIRYEIKRGKKLLDGLPPH